MAIDQGTTNTKVALFHEKDR